MYFIPTYGELVVAVCIGYCNSKIPSIENEKSCLQWKQPFSIDLFVRVYFITFLKPDCPFRVTFTIYIPEGRFALITLRFLPASAVNFSSETNAP